MTGKTLFHIKVTMKVWADVCLLLLFVSAFLIPATAHAQEMNTDTLEIFFHLDSTRIHMDYNNNLTRWNTFEENFLKHFAGRDPRYIVLDIYSGASPEGTASHNVWLGQNRGESIKQLAQRRLPGRIGEIVIHNEAARWQGLYDAIAASDEPWRDEVLSIVSQPPSVRNGYDNREWKLREMNGGSVWPVLLEKYLPPLRSGGTAIVSLRTPTDTVVVHDTIYVVQQPAQPAIIADSLNVAPVAEGDSVVETVVEYECWKPVVAFGTNLFFDALVTPNLEVEVPFGWSRWSLLAEWWTPWYVWHGNNLHDHAYEVLLLGAEGRYWLSPREPECPTLLRGHFIGVYGAGGKYDIEPGKSDHRGWQGEFTSLGVTYGYAWRLKKQWRLEVSASAGYAGGPKRSYHGMFDDAHLIWHHNRHFDYFGLTKAKVSISWLLGYKLKVKDIITNEVNEKD